MLVLSRRAGESIVIGNDVVITILEVRGGQIRVGVDAPRNLAVHRAEIYEQVLAENRAAAASTDLQASILSTKATGLRLQDPTRSAE
ncbi:MAG: carbon storage regulator CsrA [Acidimicrobiia bacterium]|nr:carbon storage regulator CsrA [Acidimicrobiia bacterium]MDH4308857.1 carbon storage regulator CsrA [Acidimicrobiia bacterium]MDH5292782.1 carbon storage regulator CsrA [Acidimicrobiia bacterium]MDH5521412.1 carbon storage regulator CsrA [Acidimicrobiia bacterium]